MKNKSLLALALVLMLAILVAACSRESPGPTTVAGTIPAVGPTTAPDLEGLSDAEMLEQVRALVEETLVETRPASSATNEFGLDERLGDRVSPEKYVPLPNGHLVGGLAVMSGMQINAGTYHPDTQFVTVDDELVSLRVVWLEPIEGDLYYVYYYMDRPVFEPTNYEFVTPYTSAVYESAQRVFNAMQTPTTCTDRYYNTDASTVYEYAFTYPGTGEYRRFLIGKLIVCVSGTCN